MAWLLYHLPATAPVYTYSLGHPVNQPIYPLLAINYKGVTTSDPLEYQHNPVLSLCRISIAYIFHFI